MSKHYSRQKPRATGGLLPRSKMVSAKQRLQTRPPPAGHELFAEDKALQEPALSVAEVREVPLAEVDVQAFFAEPERSVL